MANAYKRQSEKRRRYYVPPLLSDRDEYVPDTHIGIYQLLTNPDDPAIYMSELQCQKLRHDAFHTVYQLFKKYGSPDFTVFWNYNLESLIELGLNKFCTHTKLAPVAGIIECFEKKMPIVSNSKMRNIISFGINKHKLVKYLQDAKQARREGKTIAPPRLELKTPKTRDFILFGETDMTVGERDKIRIDRNAVYKQFCQWCELHGMTKKSVATLALKEFVEHHPINGVGDLSEYDIVTIFDKTLLAKPKSFDLDEAVNVKIDSEVYELARMIIKRYNRDVNNLGKEMLTIHTYITNALHLLNRNMPLQYRDPELYEEKRQVELLEMQAGIKQGGEKNGKKDGATTRKPDSGRNKG